LPASEAKAEGRASSSLESLPSPEEEEEEEEELSLLSSSSASS
jgi:hypothetical protein